MINTIKALAVRMYARKAARCEIGIQAAKERLEELPDIAALESLRKTINEDITEMTDSRVKHLNNMERWSK